MLCENKRMYVTPEMEVTYVQMADAILSSVENFSSYIDPNPGDWGDDPIFDDDDEIVW